MKKHKLKKKFILIGALAAVVLIVVAFSVTGESLMGKLFSVKPLKRVPSAVITETAKRSQIQKLGQIEKIPAALNNQAITRAEFSKLIVQKMGINPNPSIYTNCYPNDAETIGHWAEAYICYLVDSGVYNNTQSYFRPNDALTRAEAAKLFTTAFDLASLQTFTLYGDVPTNAWYTGYTNVLAANGIPAEEIGDMFRPSDVMLTGETGQWINSVLSYSNDTTNTAQISRGGFAALILKNLNIPIASMQATVPCGHAQGSEFEMYICYLVNQNVLSGNPTNPNTLINRAEAAKLFIQIFNLGMPGINNYSVYDDIQPSEWYTRYTNIVGMLNIPAEEIGQNFRPADSITKAETQAWLNNL